MLRDLAAVPVIIAVEDEQHWLDRERLSAFETRLAPGTGPEALALAPDLTRILEEADLDLLHLHGIWQYPSFAAGQWARRTGKPMVISPHGMLDPWITGRNKWKKWPARLLWEHRTWRSASVFHALTEVEATDIAAAVGDARVAVIPNAAPPVLQARDTMPPAGVLYLGRIHEKKNIGALIEAWGQARPSLPKEAHLTIAGWGDAESIEALNRAVLASDGSVSFVGTAFASQKAALFDVSRFLVLPSLSEGLPMTALEAWSAGLPAIMSEACHLPEGFAAGAALSCPTHVAGIAATLIEALSRSESQWLVMSQAARDLAENAFGHATIKARLEASLGVLLKA